MSTLVADASALVSLGTVADADPDPLALCLDRYDVLLPALVLEELRAIAEYDDEHGRAASTVLERTTLVETTSVELDPSFPLEDGENAAVTLANVRNADLLLCNEFTKVGLIHACLADTRLVRTPTLLSVFVRQACISATAGRRLLDQISEARSWEHNSYVQRARSLVDDGS